MSKLKVVVDWDASKVESGVKRTKSLIVKGMQKTASAAASAVKGAAKGALTGAFAFGGMAVKSAADAEKSLAKLKTIAGKDSAAIKKQLMAVPAQFGTLAENAEAAYQAISAGSKPADAMRLVAAAAVAAKGGFTDTATAVDAATSILNNYGESAGTVEEILDKFINTQNLGKTTFGEMAASIGKVAPIAQGMGISFDELQASIASVTKGGIKTAEAITGLKAAYTSIKKPTMDAEAQLIQLGFGMEQVTEKRGKMVKETVLDADRFRKFIGEEGMIGLLKKIKNESPNVAQAMTDIFSSVEGQAAAQKMIGNLGEVDQMLASMPKSAGMAKEASTIMTNTFGEQLAALKEELNRVMIGVGEEFLPKLTDMVGKLRDNAKVIKELMQAIGAAVKWAFDLLVMFGEKIGEVSGRLAAIGITARRQGGSAAVKMTDKAFGMKEGTTQTALEGFANSLPFGRQLLGAAGLAGNGNSRGGRVRGFAGGGTSAQSPSYPSAKDTITAQVAGDEGIINGNGMRKLGDAGLAALNGTTPLGFSGGEMYGGTSAEERIKEWKKRVRALFAQSADEGVRQGTETGIGDKKQKGTAAETIFAGSLESATEGLVEAALSGDVKGAVKGFAGELQNAAMNALKQAVLSGLSGLFGGGGGKLFGGLFADGGRPPVGLPSIVGERGPEVFVPDRAGTIVPNHALGGTSLSIGELNVQVGPGIEPAQAGRELAESLLRTFGEMAELNIGKQAFRRMAEAGAS